MKTSPTVLGRLLEEISWEGNARHYRKGGRGFENVLTAEVFQALNFLPRAEFLGRVVKSLQGGAQGTRELLHDQIEDLEFSFLPGDIYLAKQTPKGVPLCVQPDGILQANRVYCLIEAKRLKKACFQPEQLAREFVTTLQEARGRRPLLLLVLAEAPPVRVQRSARLPIRDAIAKYLEPVLQRTGQRFPPADQLLEQVDAIVAYITWEQLGGAVSAAPDDFANPDPSVRKAVHRLASVLLKSIEWHSNG